MYQLLTVQKACLVRNISEQTILIGPAHQIEFPYHAYITSLPVVPQFLVLFCIETIATYNIVKPCGEHALLLITQLR